MKPSPGKGGRKLDPLERLLIAGQMLSNLAFNLAQSSQLDARTRESARNSVAALDNALREHRIRSAPERARKRP